MNPSKSILIVCCVLTTALLGSLTALTLTHRHQRNIISQMATRDREVVTLKDNLRVVEEISGQLGTKLTSVTEALLDTTRQLTETRSQLTETLTKLAEARSQIEPRVANPKVKIPALPAPVVTGSKGDQNHRVIFPELLSKSGRFIARQQEFSNRLGRNVIFKDENGRRMRVDMDELHPDVVNALGIDVQSADKEQRELDARSAQFNVAARQAQAAHAAAVAQARKEQMEREAIMAVEMAKLDEERRKAMEDESIRRQTANASSLQAEAALRTADAALNQALNPPTFNLNQTIVRPLIVQPRLR